MQSFRPPTSDCVCVSIDGCDAMLAMFQTKPPCARSRSIDFAARPGLNDCTACAFYMASRATRKCGRKDWIRGASGRARERVLNEMPVSLQHIYRRQSSAAQESAQARTRPRSLACARDVSHSRRRAHIGTNRRRTLDQLSANTCTCQRARTQNML